MQQSSIICASSTTLHWLQSQKDFDKFRNSLRTRVFFANKEQNSNNNFRNNIEVNNSPKKKSNWLAPRINSCELDTFLISVKRDLFCSTKPNGNFSKEERSALKNYRKDVLFKKESELMMRLQDKGNRFAIIHKENDKNKGTATNS